MGLVVDLARGLGVYICKRRCPYRDKCGPDTQPYYDTDKDEEDARKFCLTRQHFNCSAYVQMEVEAKKKKVEAKKKETEARARKKEGGLVRGIIFGNE